MTKWRQLITKKLCNSDSGPATVTRDTFSERLKNIRENASLLYNRIKGKRLNERDYGRKRLKGIEEKEAGVRRHKHKRI